MLFEASQRSYQLAAQQEIRRTGGKCLAERIKGERRFRGKDNSVAKMARRYDLVIATVPGGPISCGAADHTEFGKSSHDCELIGELGFLPNVVCIDEGDEFAARCRN